jgi:hypothetical protein
MSTDTLDVQEALEELMETSGAVGGAIVDYRNGLTLGTIGGDTMDMELAGSGNVQVIKAKEKIVQDLDLDDNIEDILITLGEQFHLIGMCEHHDDIFIYLAIDRDEGNLGIARRAIDKVDQKLVIQ